MKVSQRMCTYVLRLTSFFFLLVFLWWHYRLGITRYIDVDEFAHLSWAYQMLSGQRPYLDFLFFFPPGFHLFLIPLFALGHGVTPIIAGRVMAFIIFVLLVGTVMLLFWLLRRSWTAILVGIILAFLPMPFDKFLEIRPDTLATLFAMVGMVFQILGMQDLALKGLTFLGKKVKPYQFLAGFLYGLSLLILPKTLPQVGVAIGVLVLMDIVRKYGKPSTHDLTVGALGYFALRPSLNPRSNERGIRVLGKSNYGRSANYNSFLFLLGLAIPLILFALWVVTLGNINQVIYSLTALPVEANKISQTFIMQPDLFFYPNTTFYGGAGWTRGLLVNHAIWVIAILVGAYRLVTPRSWSDFLVAATFFVSVIFYVLIVPLKHAQYLIPIAVFVAFYAADAVDMAWNAVRERIISLAAAIFLTLYIIGLIGLRQIFVEINTPKLSWTNRETINQLSTLYQTIPTNEYVLDLTGETIYYKHPYAVCCLPFGQFAPYLTRPLPPLARALEETKTRYIFEGGLKRINTLLP
ncbi:hypothetical protein HY087_03000, partial [Candidatus Gottesmanbacteria bacterium]|nr:hypothetical protein [Candidatus Gottesmanbacteria bacterium]